MIKEVSGNHFGFIVNAYKNPYLKMPTRMRALDP